MYILLLGALIAFGIVIKKYTIPQIKLWRENYVSEPILSFIAALLAAVVGAMVGGVIAVLMGAFSPAIDAWSECSAELVALGDSGSTEGNFFLGSGQIKEEFYYIYYYKDGQAIRQGRQKVDHSSIIETKDESPKYKWDCRPADVGKFYFVDKSERNFRFIVPPGSVQNRFNLDLE